jgi:hypothetical protein
VVGAHWAVVGERRQLDRHMTIVQCDVSEPSPCFQSITSTLDTRPGARNGSCRRTPFQYQNIPLIRWKAQTKKRTSPRGSVESLIGETPVERRLGCPTIVNWSGPSARPDRGGRHHGASRRRERHEARLGGIADAARARQKANSRAGSGAGCHERCARYVGTSDAAHCPARNPTLSFKTRPPWQSLADQPPAALLLWR